MTHADELYYIAKNKNKELLRLVEDFYLENFGKMKEAAKQGLFRYSFPIDDIPTTLSDNFENIVKPYFETQGFKVDFVCIHPFTYGGPEWVISWEGESYD